MNARTGEEFIKAKECEGQHWDPSVGEWVAHPWNHHGDVSRRDRQQTWKIWIKHIRKDLPFWEEPLHPIQCWWDDNWKQRLYCMQCLLSSFRAPGSSHKLLPTSFCFAALGALVPNLDPRVWTIVITFLQTPSVCQMKHHVKQKVSTEYRPTGQTDYYTLQTFELLPCYLSAFSSQKQPQKSPG